MCRVVLPDLRDATNCARLLMWIRVEVGGGGRFLAVEARLVLVEVREMERNGATECKRMDGRERE